MKRSTNLTLFCKQPLINTEEYEMYRGIWFT